MRPPLWFRRLVRPLLPDRFMARRRLHQQSLDVRHNADIIVTDDKRATLWQDTTPDTYRVRHVDSFGAGPALVPIDPGDDPGDAEAVLVAGTELSPALTATLAAPLADPQVAAAVLAEVPAPRLVERRRIEPRPAPAAIAVRGTAWHEVGGAPSGANPLPGLLERLRDAGHRVALVPAARAGSALRRTDPINEPATVVLSLVPLHDVGGGGRTAQLAQALLRRGHHVSFVAIQPSADGDLGLRFIHPQLEQRAADAFDARDYLDRLRDTSPLVIAAVPRPDVVRWCADLQAGGARVVYDCIDDWSSPWLGSDWYREDSERALVGAAHAVTASAPDLIERLAATFEAGAVLVPNGVDAEVFTGEPGDRPHDFPAGDGPVLGYHGTLRAEWIDWEAIHRLAAAHPDARLVLIGEPPHPRPAAPPNVHFLGLKPHHRLEAYVGRFSVGLVPFLADAATHAASPVKVYEYLAAGVPVAAPPLRSLAGLAGVSTDPDLTRAVAAALDGPPPDGAAARTEHSWDGRAAALLEAAGLPTPAPDQPRALVVERPVVHYAKDQRRPAARGLPADEPGAP